jgi:hypothetical protein
MKELLIICNGGSLRNFDFQSINRDKYDIMILGVAYRYFRKHKINFEYYICVDEVILKYNEWEICRMIKTNLLNKGMISGVVLYDNDTMNKLRRHQSKIDILENIKEKEHNPLSRVEKWTTGSCAILYGIHLGYKNISIIGLDNDHQILKNYKEKDDGTLEVINDIVDNPNYFFDEYQREGDVLNPPNKIPNLHTDAIKEALNIAKEERIKIINYNDKKSISEYIKTKPYSNFL